MRTHSEIAGPWMPEEVVMGMLVWVKRGWETKWSTPAERRWIRLRLLGSSGMDQMGRTVDGRKCRSESYGNDRWSKEWTWKNILRSILRFRRE